MLLREDKKIIPLRPAAHDNNSTLLKNKTRINSKIIRPIPDHLSAQESETPIYDKLIAKHDQLSTLSKYPCTFDYTAYKRLEERFKEKMPRGGIIYGSNDPFKLINTHPACQQCLYGFEMDTYGRGCVHNCAYCYSKIELTSHGYWNNPFPMPRDITTVWKVFYDVFETDKKSKWRKILEKRVPLRIGSGSDGFRDVEKNKSPKTLVN